MTTTLADRAKGTAFAVLYAPRAVPDSCQPPKKTGPKAHQAKKQPTCTGLQPLENLAPAFNTPIASREQSARTSRIRGRGNK